jgi:hypothetical protein
MKKFFDFSVYDIHVPTSLIGFGLTAVEHSRYSMIMLAVESAFSFADSVSEQQGYFSASETVNLVCRYYGPTAREFSSSDSLWKIIQCVMERLRTHMLSSKPGVVNTTIHVIDSIYKNTNDFIRSKFIRRRHFMKTLRMVSKRHLRSRITLWNEVGCNIVLIVSAWDGEGRYGRGCSSVPDAPARAGLTSFENVPQSSVSPAASSRRHAIFLWSEDEETDPSDKVSAASSGSKKPDKTGTNYPCLGPILPPVRNPEQLSSASSNEFELGHFNNSGDGSGITSPSLGFVSQSICNSSLQSTQPMQQLQLTPPSGGSLTSPLPRSTSQMRHRSLEACGYHSLRSDGMPTTRGLCVDIGAIEEKDGFADLATEMFKSMSSEASTYRRTINSTSSITRFSPITTSGIRHPQEGAHSATEVDYRPGHASSPDLGWGSTVASTAPVALLAADDEDDSMERTVSTEKYESHGTLTGNDIKPLIPSARGTDATDAPVYLHPSGRSGPIPDPQPLAGLAGVDEDAHTIPRNVLRRWPPARSTASQSRTTTVPVSSDKSIEIKFYGTQRLAARRLTDTS